MVMRKLSENEVKLCKKNIDIMEKELKRLNFLERYETLMIEEGCYWNYIGKVKTHKGLKSEVECDIRIGESKIKELKKQIKEGVEVKKKEEEGSHSYIG